MDDIITMDPTESDVKEQRMPKHHDKSSRSPWSVEIDVHLNPPGSVPPFYLETALPKDEDGNILFYNAGRPGFDISFVLHDDKNPGYRFPNPPGPSGQKDPSKWALWSREGPGCPPENYNGQWEEFTSKAVHQNGKVLVVRNLNNEQADFGYTLRVTKDGSNFLALDPGGRNMNGSTFR